MKGGRFNTGAAAATVVEVVASSWGISTVWGVEARAEITPRVTTMKVLSNEDKFWIHTDLLIENKRHKKKCADGKIGPQMELSNRSTRQEKCVCYIQNN